MQVKTETYSLPIAYSIVTPESAEQGDFAETGWEDEKGCTYDSLEELADVIQQHGPVEPCGNWFTTIDPDQDWETGEDTQRSFFPERNGEPFEGWDIRLADRLWDLVEGR